MDPTSAKTQSNATNARRNQVDPEIIDAIVKMGSSMCTFIRQSKQENRELLEEIKKLRHSVCKLHRHFERYIINGDLMRNPRRRTEIEYDEEGELTWAKSTTRKRAETEHEEEGELTWTKNTTRKRAEAEYDEEAQPGCSKNTRSNEKNENHGNRVVAARNGDLVEAPKIYGAAQPSCSKTPGMNEKYMKIDNRILAAQNDDRVESSKTNGTAQPSCSKVEKEKDAEIDGSILAAQIDELFQLPKISRTGDGDRARKRSRNEHEVQPSCSKYSGKKEDRTFEQDRAARNFDLLIEAAKINRAEARQDFLGSTPETKKSRKSQ